MKGRDLLVGVLLALLAVAAVGVAQEEDFDLEDDIDMDTLQDSDFTDITPNEEEEEDEEITPPVQEERPHYVAPTLAGNAYFTATFDTEADFAASWVVSSAKKEDTDDTIAKYDGKWSIEEPSDNPLQGDQGLVLKSRAKHHAVSSKLDKPFKFTGKPLIVQYEVKFQTGQECGGAYIKLLSDTSLQLDNFMDKTPYTIMFGPDKCGNDNKLHFIFRHKNPVTGEFEEKHSKKPSGTFDKVFTDKKTHLFTLVVNPDNTFEVLVDQYAVNSGSLLDDFEPHVNPAKEIVDTSDMKPEDWDERERIADPEATKPDDWDETEPEKIPDEDAEMPEGWLEDQPELVADPDAEKPDDWDDDMDGEWEAPSISNPECESAPGCGKWERPQIKNPKFKGKWKAPMMDNPSYKGKWTPRTIENPNYFDDQEPYKMTPIGAVGLELWSMSDDIYFDNFIITDNKKIADKWAADTWELKKATELTGSSGKSVVDAVMDATSERPWLWAVLIVVVVLPIVLIIVYCCMPSKDETAQRKKTDEVTADDEEEEEDESSEAKEESQPEAGGDAKPQKKKGKGALDANTNADDNDIAAADDKTADDKTADDNDDSEEKDASNDSSPRRSARKRKTKPQKE